MIEVPINPDLPDDFETTDNSSSPIPYREWWYVVFIVTQELLLPSKKYPKAKHYSVRVRDGSCLYGSTLYSNHASLSEAKLYAQDTQLYMYQCLEYGLAKYSMSFFSNLEKSSSVT